MQQLGQIAANEEKKRLEKLEWEEEGRKLRQKVADDMLKLETIKERKVKAMQESGLDGRYNMDLKKMKLDVGM